MSKTAGLIRIGIALLLSESLASQALAAVRTTSFSAVGAVRSTQIEGYNLSNEYLCKIVVMNASSQSQKLTGVSFNFFDPQTGNVLTDQGASEAEYFPTSGGTTTPAQCTFPKELSTKGSMCVLTLAIPVWTSAEIQSVCTGQITVEDTDPSKPGFVVASGVLLTNAESLLVGGALSGALYLSGAHLFGTGGLQSPPTGFTFPTMNSHYMNMFCVNACRKAQGIAESGDSSTNDKWCVRNCGHSIEANDNPNAGWTFGVLGSVETQEENYKSGKLGLVTPSPSPSIVPGVTRALVTQEGRRGTANNTTDNGVDLRLGLAVSSLRTANAHYAGGMVLEMAIGPTASICTANKIAWDRGASEFTHYDSVDSHAFIAGNGSAGTYPPERLICQHRHQKSDLVFGQQLTLPIVINGGAPF
jgi:hypothetical protein